MSLYTVPQKLKNYSSLLHSAAWDRSRRSKSWKGQVPVRWNFISTVKVSAWMSQVHKLAEDSVQLFLTFPALWFSGNCPNYCLGQLPVYVGTFQSLNAFF